MEGSKFVRYIIDTLKRLGTFQIIFTQDSFYPLVSYLVAMQIKTMKSIILYFILKTMTIPCNG